MKDFKLTSNLWNIKIMMYSENKAECMRKIIASQMLNVVYSVAMGRSVSSVQCNVTPAEVF